MREPSGFLRAFVRDKQFEKGFDQIATGRTEQEVLKRLGPPKRVKKCGEFFGPLRKEVLENYSREYFYASPFAPRLPQYYDLRFDASSRVRSKTPYSSP
jgi:hypothetical protein